MTQVWMCGRCKSLNEATAKRCYRCRADRATQEYVDPSGSPNAPGLAAAPPRDPSIVGALVLGLIAAVLATAVWYWWDAHAATQVFRLAWLVGVAIGVAVTLGGRGRTSFPIVLLSVFLTIVSLVVGEYLLISHFIAVNNAIDTDRIVVADPGDVVEALPRVLAAVPLRPVMWLIAIVAAFVGPWGRLVGPAPSRRS